MRDIYLRAKGRTVIRRGDMLDLIYHNTPPCVDPGTQGGDADMEKIRGWAHGKIILSQGDGHS